MQAKHADRLDQLPKTHTVLPHDQGPGQQAVFSRLRRARYVPDQRARRRTLVNASGSEQACV
jgi:hypothetical protein